MLSLWDEPAAPDAPRRVWRDWVLVGVLAATAVLEALLRTDVVWPVVSFLLAVGLLPTLLWRRTHPLAAVVVVFGALSVLNVVALAMDAGSFGIYSSIYVLLLPYSLIRWGSGRQMVLGLPLVLLTGGLGIAAAHTPLGEAVLGGLFLLLPCVLGLAVRYWSTSRLRERDQVKLLEREQLARELHDAVAHHVSAIAIRAQAGQVLGPTDPAAAVDALKVIEEEASKALSEMRAMVSALRDDTGAELSPQRGIADIALLAGAAGESLQVSVDVDGDIETVRPAVAAATFRIAQEAITNAVRHARHASRVDVHVSGDDDCVRLTVMDDGEPTSAGRAGWGYGIVGMTERAALLGGTLEAGPVAGRGWRVAAVLPRTAVTS